MYTLYFIYNFITNYVYIGQSIRIKDRFRRHKSDLKLNRHANDHLQNAWNKYGEDAFELYIFHTYSTQLELDEAESFYIKWYQELNLCYNFESSPRGYGPLSEITKKKISLSLTGRTASEETRKKLSEAHKGRKLNDKQRQALLNSNYNRIISKATRQKMSLAKKGIPLSDSHKQSLKLIKRRGREFELVSPEGILFQGTHLKDFAKKHNLTASNLSHVLAGKLKSHKGWTSIKPTKF